MVESQKRPIARERHTDGVEAKVSHARMVWSLFQPLSSDPAHLSALANVDRLERVSSRITREARLDLTEDQGPRACGNDVKLTPTGSEVALQDAEPAAPQMVSCELLTQCAEFTAAIITHAGDATARPVTSLCREVAAL